ncbi:hypothetical protein GCM10010112_62140 [Actinoplanes lobatus]|nr:hypothetical protein GCM10010112_62140 [Actinoplanes lobatus]
MAGDGLSRGLSEMWRSVVLYLPSILVFLVILVLGYLLARLARTVTAKTLRRAGFDRAVQRGPAGRLLRPGAPSATDVCARLAFFVVLLFALQLAFGVFGPNPASDLINALLGWLPQVFVGIVIVVVTAAIAGAAHDLILAVLGGLGYARVLAKAVAAVIVTLGVIAGLDQVGIATSVTRPLLVTILATVAGVIIVGVGGGLIRPMQQRWEGWLDRAAAESAAIREQARAYAEERARQTAEKPSAEPSSSSGEGEPPTPSSSGGEPPTPPSSGGEPPAPPSSGGEPPAPPSSGGEPPAYAAGGGEPSAYPAAPSAPESPASSSPAVPSTEASPRAAARDFPDDAEELAWEARWAEEERRIREQDGDETQMIIASPAGPGDDERTTDLHPEERTTDLHPEERTTDLHPEERTTDLHPEERTTDLYSGERTTDLHGGERTTDLYSGERTTDLHGDEPTTVLTAGPTTVLTAGPSADEVMVIRSPGTEAGLQIVDDGGEERTQVVPLPATAAGPPSPRKPEATPARGPAPTGDDDPTMQTRPGGTSTS